MASLQEIKERLNSIGATKKITKAMQLVATAKLKKTQSNLKNTQKYYFGLRDMFWSLFNGVHDKSEIYPKNADNKVLYIVISSDLGLAGAYNSNILKLTKAKLKSNDILFTIGTKALAHFNAINRPPDEFWTSVGDNPNYDVASQIGKKVVELFNEGKINKVKIAHTSYINSITYEAKLTQLLPIISDNDNDIKTLEAEYEPDQATIIKQSLPLWISGSLYSLLAESKVSEMSSRRAAMENATDNAEELLENLNIQFNRARQASITQELNEIVAGSGLD